MFVDAHQFRVGAERRFGSTLGRVRTINEEKAVDLTDVDGTIDGGTRGSPKEVLVHHTAPDADANQGLRKIERLIGLGIDRAVGLPDTSRLEIEQLAMQLLTRHEQIIRIQIFAFHQIDFSTSFVRFRSTQIHRATAPRSLGDVS